MTSHFLLLDGQKEVEVEEDLRKKRQRHIINVQTSEFQIILQEPATPPLPVRPLAFRHNAGGLSKGGGGRGPDRPGGGAGGCDPSDRFRSGRRGVWSSGVDRHGRPGGRGGAALTGGRREAEAGAGGGVGLLLADGGGGGGGLSRVSGKEERLAGGIGGGRSSPRPGAGGGGGRPAWPAEGEGMEGGRPNAAGTWWRCGLSSRRVWRWRGWCRTKTRSPWKWGCSPALCPTLKGPWGTWKGWRRSSRCFRTWWGHPWARGVNRFTALQRWTRGGAICSSEGPRTRATSTGWQNWRSDTTRVWERPNNLI